MSLRHDTPPRAANAGKNVSRELAACKTLGCSKQLQNFEKLELRVVRGSSDFQRDSLSAFRLASQAHTIEQT